MTREDAKRFLPIIKAFSEGKIIEFRTKGFDEDWREISQILNLSFDAYEYRVKPTPKYRPFKDAEECLQEMQKHQPFGWVKYKDGRRYTNYCTIDNNCFFEADFDDYTFADGAPFGIRVEENPDD